MSDPTLETIAKDGFRSAPAPHKVANVLARELLTLRDRIERCDEWSVQHGQMIDGHAKRLTALERVQRDAETEPEGWASRRIAEVERQREMEYAAKLEVQRIGREVQAECDYLREAMVKAVYALQVIENETIDEGARDLATDALREQADLASATPAEGGEG